MCTGPLLSARASLQLQCAYFQRLSVRASLSSLLSLAQPIFMRQSKCLFPSWSPFCQPVPLHFFFLLLYRCNFIVLPFFFILRAGFPLIPFSPQQFFSKQLFIAQTTWNVTTTANTQKHPCLNWRTRNQRLHGIS